MSLNSTIFTATYIKYIDNNGTLRLGFIVNNQGDGILTVGRLSDTDYFDREALENNVDGCIMHGIPFIDSTDVFAFDDIKVKQITEVNPEWNKQITDMGFIYTHHNMSPIYTQNHSLEQKGKHYD